MHRSRFTSVAVRIVTLTILAAVVASPPAAVATPYTWSGASGATWDTSGTNWVGSPAAPWDASNGPTNTATFAPASATTGTAVVSGVVTTNVLTFAPATTGTFTLTGGTIALGGGTSAQIMNLLAGGTVGATAASTLTIASTITSATNFFIGGFGTTILSGSNSLAGTVTIGSGTSQVVTPIVQLNNSNALAGATAVVLLSGGTSAANTGQQLALGNGVTIAGIPLTISTTTAAGRAALVVAAGNTATWNGNITLSGSNNPHIYAYGTLTLGSGTDTLVTGASGVLRGTGTGIVNSALGFLSKNDAGTWIINSASNTFSTNANVANGVLQIGSIANAGSASPIGSGSSISFGQALFQGTLRFTGSSGGSTNRAIVINSATAGSGAIIDSAVVGQTLTLAGNVTTGTTSLGLLRLTGSGNGVLSGSIAPASANNFITLDKAGSGTWTLSGSNAHSGTTTISAGVLALGSTNALPTTGTISFRGGTLQYGPNNTVDFSGRIVGSGSAISIDTNGQAVTFASSLDASNTGGLTKSGAGLLTLSTSNAYAGSTTVSGGTLSITDASALGSSAANLSASGGVLDLGGFTVTRTGTVSFTGGTVQNGTLSNDTVAYDAQSGTVSASLTGTAGLSKTTSGNLNLTGNATSIGSGGITLNGGTTVIDPGAAGTFTTTGKFYVGSTSGTSVVTLASGSVGLVAPTNSYINLADNANANATLNVTGGTATFALTNGSGRMMVGNKGTATLNVSGGLVQITGGSPLYIGGDQTYAQSNANGTFTISGGTVAITGSGSFFLGNSGTVGNANTGVTGTLNLNGGELQTIRSITTGTSGTAANAQSGYVYFNGGLLKPLASSTSFLQGLTAAYVQNGGARIDTNGYDITVGQALLSGTGGSTGGLTKSGAGTLTLTGASTYAGATTVAGGTLAISGGLNRLPSGSALALTGGAVAVTGAVQTNQTVASLTVSDSTSAAFLNASSTTSTLTVTNAVALGRGSGTATLLVQPTTAYDALITASNGITLNAGSDLRLGAVITGSNTFNGGRVNGPVTINSGGSLTLAALTGTAGGFANTGAVAVNAVGPLTMSGGRLYIDNSGTNADRRMSLNGSMAITGGTVAQAAAAFNGNGLALSGSSTGVTNATTGNYTFNVSPASYDPNIGVSVYATGTTSLTLGMASNQVPYQLMYRNWGSQVLSSTASGNPIANLLISDASSTPGVGNTVQLGSNLTLVSTGALPQQTYYSLILESGRADVGIDVNGYTFDMTANSGTWQPNASPNTGTTAQTYWQLSSSSGTGTFIANGFNFVYASGSNNAYTSVGPNVVLQARGGNSVANNLGSGTISATSVFRYSGTATAASPATLTSATTIGDLEVTGSGALKILSLAGGAQNLRVSSGVLDLGGSNSITFAQAATISGGTVQSGTITAAGYSLQAGSVSAVLAGSGVALTKSSSGTATLSGANTFTGGVTMGGGLLNLGNPSALGTGPLTISGGTLGNSSGATLTVSTANSQTWSGDFAFAGGNSLDLGTGNVSLSASPTVTTTSGTLTVGGAISGAGFSLTKAGAGVLVLSGSSTYDGGTTISAGTLQIGNDGAAGWILGDVANNGVLLFKRSDNVTYAGTISGTGSLTKQGAGTLTLTAANTFTGNVTIGNAANSPNYVLRIENSEALGPASAVKSVSATGNNQVTSILELAAGVTVDANKTLFTTGHTFYTAGSSNQGTPVFLRSAGGSNTWLGSVVINGGGGAYYVEASAGTLTLGSEGTSSVLRNEVAGSTRTFDFRGPGATVVYSRFTGGTTSGAVTGLNMIGTGTLTIARTDNDFTYAPKLSVGTTRVASLADGGATSPLGTGSSFNLGGTLEHLGGANSTSNRSIGIEGAAPAVVASGTGTLALTNTGAITYSDPTSVLVYTFSSGATTLVGSAVYSLMPGFTLSGTGIAPGTTVTAVNYDTRVITLSQATTASATTVSLTVGGQNTVARTFVLGGTNTGVNTLASRLVDKDAATAKLSLSKAGAGTWALTGSNGYSGSTSIEAGTLRIGDGGTAGWIGSTSGITVAGGALLAFNRTDGYGGAFDRIISGSGGVRVEAGRLNLTGASTYTGTTDVLSGGTLLVNGSLVGDVAVAAGATLGGSGVYGNQLSGAGTISVGNSPGIGTAASVDPSLGTDWVFEITGTAPTWSQPVGSVNDVLRLTGASPFAASLTGANEVAVLFDVSGGVAQGSYLGGFYSDLTDFTTAITSGNFTFWVSGAYGDAGNQRQFAVGSGGSPVIYSPLAAYDAALGVSVSVVQQSVSFDGSTTVNGYSTQFVVVPEPAGLALAGLGAVAAAAGLTRRRRDRRTA